MNGQQLDLSSTPSPRPSEERVGRFLGVRFTCCKTYSRIYLNRAGDAYQGHCPRCAKPIRIGVGPGGTDARFFTAG